jgi:hypothetical protein|tara:strand:- start:14 stop:184 length:171 start_codon:yes stop_codon:yes gene_type:complete
MELVGLLALALIVGLIIRKRGDNTMDTMGKGCGCLFIGFIIIIALAILIFFVPVTP